MLVEKINKKINIINFSNILTLQKYLKQYVISEQVFELKTINTKEEYNILSRYYDEAYDNACRLVTDDEYVGITFDNLDIMNKCICKVKAKFFKN